MGVAEVVEKVWRGRMRKAMCPSGKLSTLTKI